MGQKKWMMKVRDPDLDVVFVVGVIFFTMTSDFTLHSQHEFSLCRS